MRPEFTLSKSLLRMAEYEIKARTTPGYEVEYQFYRQFKDPKEALLSIPYNERNLPYTAKRALKGLKPGDLFSFRGKMTLLFDATAFCTTLL